MIKILFFIISFFLLIYLLLPGPNSVNQFPPLPNSVKSTEPGDSDQNPNTAAYFSDLYRQNVIPFYKEAFSKNFVYFNIKMPYLRLNHPPQYASEVIRPYQQSYYLEEFVHPLRESLYVNGWEPYDEAGKARFKYSHGIVIDQVAFKTKTTIKYYDSPIWVRVLVWMGITVFIFLLFQMFIKINLKKNG